MTVIVNPKVTVCSDKISVIVEPGRRHFFLNRGPLEVAVCLFVDPHIHLAFIDCPVVLNTGLISRDT